MILIPNFPVNISTKWYIKQPVYLYSNVLAIHPSLPSDVSKCRGSPSARVQTPGQGSSWDPDHDHSSPL